VVLALLEAMDEGGFGLHGEGTLPVGGGEDGFSDRH
jgi:hypothetical protein